MEWLILLALNAAAAVASGYLAHGKNRTAPLWAALTFVFPPLLIAVALMPAVPRRR